MNLESFMKPRLSSSLLLGLSVLLVPALRAADTPVAVAPASAPAPAAALTVFDLDFPGGTPKELVAAIEKATHKPLNAVIPDEFGDWKLPSLTLRRVNVADLFTAMERMAVNKTFVAGIDQYRTSTVSASFRSSSRRPEDLNDATIWYFFVNGPGTPAVNEANVTRYYRLAPYLDCGLSVDDITTAVQTGWKMEGNTHPAKLSYHKETKLLIAVGEQSAVENIDAVLRALEPATIKPATPHAPTTPEKKG